jgi:hypothetical protein
VFTDDILIPGKSRFRGSVKMQLKVSTMVTPAIGARRERAGFVRASSDIETYDRYLNLQRKLKMSEMAGYGRT